MKKIMNVYESSKVAIRIAFLGFILIGFGFLIQNESVNIFYTFRNTFVLLFAEGCYKLGQAIIMNLPMIFMLNIVCKRANSAYPVALAILGYFAFLITTSLFTTTNLPSGSYATGLGINSIFNIASGTRYPLETGLVGSFIVAYLTRVSFVRSRHRSTLSILGFLNKDTAGFIYNIVLCTLAGIGVSYVMPYILVYLQRTISYIGEDLMDPVRIGIYGVLDRVFCILGNPSIIRQPFWYGATGGSFQTVSGQSILGDVNIWNYIKGLSTTYIGAGRFITPYYVINMFVVPAILVGTFLSITDPELKKKYIFPFLGLILVSIVCGNPLPIELVLLFTSPLLLCVYLLVVFASFAYTTYAGIYLGSNIATNSIVTAMPGNFPDFIINLRNVYYLPVLGKICTVGIVLFVVMLIAVILYSKHFAYDILKSGKTSRYSKEVIEAVGGKENINYVGSDLFRVCVHVHDLEKIDIEKIQDLDIKRVSEIRDGLALEVGSSALMLTNRINILIKYSKS